MKAGTLPLASVRVQLVSEPTPLEGGMLAAAENVAAAAWQLIGRADREHLVAFFTDVHRRVVTVHTVGIGTAGAALCDTAGLFRAALLAGAHGVLVVHNHPSGTAEFSSEDLKLWGELRLAGAALGIKMHDFLLITPTWGKWSSAAREDEAALHAARRREFDGYQRRSDERRARGNRNPEEREAFAAAVVEGKRAPGDLVGVAGGTVTLRRLVSRLYSATAALPDPAREALGMRLGATYAGAARRLLGSWKPLRDPKEGNGHVEQTGT